MNTSLVKETQLSLETLQQKIEAAKLRLAEVTAKEKLLSDQKAEWQAELQKLGVTPETLEATIQELEEQYSLELQKIEEQLAKLPPQLYNA